MLLETYNNPFVSPYPKPVMETLSVALRNNINELNQILKDVEVCCIQDTDKNWIISPDQNGA